AKWGAFVLGPGDRAAPESRAASRASRFGPCGAESCQAGRVRVWSGDRTASESRAASRASLQRWLENGDLKPAGPAATWAGLSGRTLRPASLAGLVALSCKRERLRMAAVQACATPVGEAGERGPRASPRCARSGPSTRGRARRRAPD